MTWRASIALAALAAGGCVWGAPPPPRLAGATPSWSLETDDVLLVVFGDGFDPDVVVDFEHPSRSRPDGSMGIELRRSGLAPIRLEGVHPVSATELRGHLAAGAAPPATYDLVVIGPGGTAALPGFFAVRVDDCSVEGSTCRDGDPCTESATCQAGRCQGTPVHDGEECSLSCLSSIEAVDGECLGGTCVPRAGECTVP